MECMVYVERNKKVSEAVKIWAALHPKHYKEMGIRL
jgi:hypothetical protein